MRKWSHLFFILEMWGGGGGLPMHQCCSVKACGGVYSMFVCRGSDPSRVPQFSDSGRDWGRGLSLCAPLCALLLLGCGNLICEVDAKTAPVSHPLWTMKPRLEGKLSLSVIFHMRRFLFIFLVRWVCVWGLTYRWAVTT